MSELPTTSEQEILDLMQEECSEIIFIISKLRRFGYNSTHPDGGDNNYTILLKEMSDFLALKQVFQKKMVTPEYIFTEYKQAKLEKLKKFSTIDHNLLRE